MLWQWRNGVWILNKVYVIGMGPGAYEQMTVAAVEALKGCDVIVGYTVYVDLMKKYFPEKEFMTTPMRKEPERCRMAFEEAKKGRVTLWCAVVIPGFTEWQDSCMKSEKNIRKSRSRFFRV